jgi:hypothetical protein
MGVISAPQPLGLGGSIGRIVMGPDSMVDEVLGVIVGVTWEEVEEVVIVWKVKGGLMVMVIVVTLT